jgi:hypothetical protein
LGLGGFVAVPRTNCDEVILLRCGAVTAHPALHDKFVKQKNATKNRGDALGRIAPKVLLPGTGVKRGKIDTLRQK